MPVCDSKPFSYTCSWFICLLCFCPMLWYDIYMPYMCFYLLMSSCICPLMILVICIPVTYRLFFVQRWMIIAIDIYPETWLKDHNNESLFCVVISYSSIPYKSSCSFDMFQLHQNIFSRAQNVIISSLLSQNDVVVSFWRNNGVILTS